MLAVTKQQLLGPLAKRGWLLPRRGFPATMPNSNDNDYPHYEVRQTRWNDNDGFGHLNNTVYYNFMDDAINLHLINRGIGRQYPRFIAENGIQFFKPISFPSDVNVGLKVIKLGSSSVTYEVGFFAQGEPTNGATGALAARGKFVHVYVDEATGRPMAIPEEARNILETLLTPTQPGG